MAVNRIWQRLFSEGLVRTVDNFGVMGDVPSHPELLDYLAQQFIRNGWSQKKLIREIVLSRTYQLSATENETAIAKDPSNKWLVDTTNIDPASSREAALAALVQSLFASAEFRYVR